VIFLHPPWLLVREDHARFGCWVSKHNPDSTRRAAEILVLRTTLRYCQPPANICLPFFPLRPRPPFFFPFTPTLYKSSTSSPFFFTFTGCNPAPTSATRRTAGA